MPRSYRLPYVAAVGIALAGAVHAEPVSNDPGSQTSAAKAQEQPQADNTPLVLEAIKNAVESVTRTIESSVNQPKSAEEKDHARRDLRAQERMAYWAKLMFWAATAGVFLTLVGVGLIYRTLVHTRRAAEAARDMVTDGKNATAAAMDAAKEAKRQADLAEQSFQRLERPYIYIFGVHQIETDVSMTNHVKYSVANFGRTPAKITILEAGMGTHPEEPIDPLMVDYRDDPAHDLLVRPILPPNDVREGLRIAPPDGISFHPPKTYEGIISFTHENLAPVLNGRDQFFVWIRIQYRGPEGGYMTNACWRFDKLTFRLVPWGEDQKYNGMV